jgi:hypothetical protein
MDLVTYRHAALGLAIELFRGVAWEGGYVACTVRLHSVQVGEYPSLELT